MASIVSSHQEQVLYHYILTDGNFTALTKPEFFTNDILKLSFEISKEYALKYKTAPTKEQFTELIKIKGLSEKINDDIIVSLYNTKNLLEQYGDDWLKENVGAWIQTRNLDSVMRKSLAYLKTTSIGVDNASEVVNTVRNMISSETAIDFNFSGGLDFFDAASHLQTKLARTSSGYDYIDLCLKGGYWKGSLILFLSFIKAGKSLWLGNLAAKSCLSGYNTAYITLELQAELVNMRIGANMLNIPIDNYEEVVKDQEYIKNKINELKQNSFIQPGQLIVKEFASGTMSTNDLRNFLIKEEERLGIKFDNVFIDYLGIMKNWRNPNTENMYLKLKQISEDLRACGQENNWCICSALQTNRSGFNNNDIQLTDVAESAGILHTVDVLFAILTDPEMKAKGEYYLKCLADRVAKYENTKKRFTIDWKYFRIEEDMSAPIIDVEGFMAPINGTKSKTFMPQSKNLINQSVQSVQQEPITIQNLDDLDMKSLF